MLLHLSTWSEIEAYLKRSRTVVVPIGSNEQHGPTGLLGTDWLCPEIIAHIPDRDEVMIPQVCTTPSHSDSSGPALRVAGAKKLSPPVTPISQRRSYPPPSAGRSCIFGTSV